MRWAFLSGWPSVTDSEVNRNSSPPGLIVMAQQLLFRAVVGSSYVPGDGLGRMAPEDVDHARDVVAAVPPSGVLGQRDPGPRYLPAARRATQLDDRLDDLSQAGGADRMPASEQAAAGVDRPRAAEPGATASDQRRAAARLGQAELLVDDELRGRSGVMHLDAVQVSGSQPGLLVRGGGS